LLRTGLFRARLVVERADGGALTDEDRETLDQVTRAAEARDRATEGAYPLEGFLAAERLAHLPPADAAPTAPGGSASRAA
jgi:hypothetical protein